MIGASVDSTKTPLHDLLASADRFWGFYTACAEALDQRIEAATGKTVMRAPEFFRAGVVAEAYDEGPAEWDAEEPIEDAVS
jgi:hypothetical protein